MNSAPSTKTKVLRLRLKDKHARFLSEFAREVNFVWNYCNELQITMFNRERRFLSGYDFAKFTRGATKEGLHLHSQTVQAIAEEYATRRRQCRPVRLSWRMRAWTCGACGTIHDRNVNAAKNILAAGRRRLAEGIPAIYGAGGRQ
jgi:transposase